MTFLSASKDKLMFVASILLYPVAPVCFSFSLPAKSTKLIFEDLMTMSSSIRCLVSTDMLRIECEREDVAFILVSLVVRNKFPRL
jgi:hypothetical protein